MYLYKLHCNGCSAEWYGNAVPEQEINPFYYSRRSLPVRDKYLKSLGMTYSQYLVSDHWMQVKSRFSSRCDVCGSGTNIHHRTYRNIGNERDGDLYALCSNSDCPMSHKKAHRRGKIKEIAKAEYCGRREKVA
jgi:hypothetical protein